MSYYMVHMGQLDHLNGSASYAFPNRDAAEFFALNHKRRDPHREISVEAPNGTVKVIPELPGTFYKRDFVDEAERGIPRYGNEQADKIKADTLRQYRQLENRS